MKKLILLSVLALMLASCRSVQPVQVERETTTITITETIRDSIVYTRPDSASIRALLACDSLGNVYMQQIVELKAGQHVRPRTRIVDNVIVMHCDVDSMAVYISWKERFEHRSDSVSVVLTHPPKKPPGIFKRGNRFRWLAIGLAIGLSLCFVSRVADILRTIKHKF
jgi:hypothetical protein